MKNSILARRRGERICSAADKIYRRRRVLAESFGLLLAQISGGKTDLFLFLASTFTRCCLLLGKSKMPGYTGVVPVGNPRKELYCSQCLLLLREALQTAEGDRICRSCWEGKRRSGVWWTLDLQVSGACFATSIRKSSIFFAVLSRSCC